MSQTTTIKVGESAKTITLAEGKALILTGSAGAVGVAYLLDPALGGTNSLRSWAVGTGALAAIGPYENTQKIHLTCSAGSIAAVVKEAVLTISAAPTPTAPGQPAKPVLTAMAGAVSLAWTPGADGSTATTGNVWTDINGNTTALTTNPQVITAAAGTPYTGTVKTQNAQGFGLPSVQADAVTPTASLVNMIVGNRTSIPQQVRANGGAAPEFQQWCQGEVVNACSSLLVRFGNFDGAAGNGASALTLRVGVNSAGGSARVNGVWQSSGGIDATLAPGGADGCLFVGNFAAGQILSFVVKGTYATAPTNWPDYGLDLSTVNHVNEIGTGLTDKTTTSGQPGTCAVGGAIIRPIAILGDVAGTPTSPYAFILLGDSITSGGQSDGNNLVNNQYYSGWAQRFLQDTYPWANIGYSGLALANLIIEDAAHQAVRNSPIPGSKATHILITLSTNDLTSKADAAGVTQVKGYVTTLNNRYLAMGIKPIFCTCPPRTNNANTAPTAYGTGAGRDDFNAWLKANFPRVLDIASVFQDATNSQLWRSDLAGGVPGDGTHPTVAMHNLGLPYANTNIPPLLVI